MKRWIFNTAAAMSLVLCLGAVGLWVESYTLHRTVAYHRPPKRCVFVSDEGKTAVFIAPSDGREGWSQSRVPAGHVKSALVSWNHFLDAYHWGFGYGWAESTLLIPHWFLALLFAIFPAVWIRRRRNRIPPGHCQKCGYDLRASEERCPECGTAIPGHEAAEGRL